MFLTTEVKSSNFQKIVSPFNIFFFTLCLTNLKNCSFYFLSFCPTTINSYLLCCCSQLVGHPPSAHQLPFVACYTPTFILSSSFVAYQLPLLLTNHFLPRQLNFTFASTLRHHQPHSDTINHFSPSMATFKCLLVSPSISYYILLSAGFRACYHPSSTGCLSRPIANPKARNLCWSSPATTY